MEGLLPPTRSADVRRHLDECSLCTDVHDSLEEIRGLLGTLAGPPQMPADVASRIDAALAAEALLNASAPAVDSTRAATSASTARAEADGIDGAHVSRETSPVADRPAGRPRAATGPGRAERTRRPRRRTAVLGAVLTVATLGLGTVFIQSMGDTTPDGPTAARSEDASERIFSGDTLENQVTKLLTQKQRMESFGTASKPVTPGSTTEGPSILGAIDVPGCVREGIGRNEMPLGARQGRYQGTEAYLVVLSDTSDTDDRVTAYVVDAGCVGKSPAPPGEVLTRQTFDRPVTAPSTGP
ncbi:hypothetical protein [Streptomyces poonensis]|uniref:hypothetical protein n=1 Tax=Streptomyces poonensis TaxID=68255 RepID=UPI0035A25FFE